MGIQIGTAHARHSNHSMECKFGRKFEPFEWISHMANFGGYGVPYTKGYLRTVLPVFTLATIIDVSITHAASSPADGCCYGYFISAWVKFIVCRLLKKCILQNSLSKQEETNCGFDHKYFKKAIRPVKTYRHKQCYHNLQDYKHFDFLKTHWNI